MATVSSTTQSAASGTLAQASTKAAGSIGDSVTEDRFLKLLMAQMKNQDPLNPMDNAQLTSQMAQISTVSGLEKLNVTTASLGSQFSQLQATQAAALVGHDVAVEGKSLRISNGQGDGGFELASDADKVVVSIQDASGNEVGKVSLEKLEAGRHRFDWAVPENLRDNRLAGFGVSTLNGYHAAKPRLVQDLFDKLMPQGVMLDVRWLSLLNVRYLVLTQPLPPEQVVRVGRQDAAPWLLEGWADAEGAFRWNEALHARLCWHGEAAAGQTLVLKLRPNLELQPGVPGPRAQRIVARLDGALAGQWTLAEPGHTSLRIPLVRGHEGGDHVLELDLPDGVGSAELGLGLETRPLAVALAEFKLELSP